MLTRGIVEKILTKYLIKVRIPTLDRSLSSSVKVNPDNLSDCPICTLSHYDPNLQVGDVVIVGFEDNTLGKPIILGYLYKQDMGNSYGNFDLNSLNVKLHSSLPKDTTIGEIKSSEIAFLKDVKGNIQGQLNSLNDKIKKPTNIIDLNILLDITHKNATIINNDYKMYIFKININSINSTILIPDIAITSSESIYEINTVKDASTVNSLSESTIASLSNLVLNTLTSYSCTITLSRDNENNINIIYKGSGKAYIETIYGVQ